MPIIIIGILLFTIFGLFYWIVSLKGSCIPKEDYTDCTNQLNQTTGFLSKNQEAREQLNVEVGELKGNLTSCISDLNDSRLNYSSLLAECDALKKEQPPCDDKENKKDNPLSIYFHPNFYVINILLFLSLTINFSINPTKNWRKAIFWGTLFFLLIYMALSFMIPSIIPNKYFWINCIIAGVIGFLVSIYVYIKNKK